MRLKAWRAQGILTQAELAEASGVSIHTIRGIEVGKHLPAPRTARALAAALGVNPLDIDEVAEAVRRGTERAEGKGLVGSSPTR